ncbi:MAG TPA: hypothetical protein VMZ04_10015 [Anaerolineae bacterium]|nr:hypothetical protein [Anaerolineae bacterium]
MAIGIKHQRPLNPILEKTNRVIAEAIAYAFPTAQYVGTSDVISEAVVQATGAIQQLGSSSIIAEAISPPTFSNQKNSTSLLNIAEAIVEVSLYGSGGGLDIFDEGILVKSKATHIDIIGADARADVDGTGVKIWHPAPAYSSHFNTSDGTNVATVADVATASRWVATPSGGEGIPFYTNAWAGAQHPTTRTSPLTWATANECSFVSASTTFNILITNGNAPADTVVNFTTGSVTGDGVYAGSNCTITITNWVAESDKYSADVSVAVDIATLFPTGGYFDITISHINGADGTFTKTQ